MRRKGERPIVKELVQWSENHPVAHAIRTGDHWFRAWQVQACTPLAKLARATGIPIGRFFAIEQGSAVSKAEIDALARAWGLSASDLEACIGDTTQIVA